MTFDCVMKYKIKIINYFNFLSRIINVISYFEQSKSIVVVSALYFLSNYYFLLDFVCKIKSL
jgi:flagellar biosynthesis protein FlhB